MRERENEDEDVKGREDERRGARSGEKHKWEVGHVREWKMKAGT